jgi:type I restriction enzyme S subunit
MRELVRLREPDVSVHPTEIYHFAGVYSFGRGVFRSKRKTGSEFSYKRLTKLSTDNFVYPKLMAWEGALGIVPPECNGLVVSPEFPVFEIDESKVLPETLDVYFRTPSVWPLLAEVSTGTNVRRRRLHPRVFLSYEFPLPPMPVQVKLREINDELTKIRQLQEETVIGLDALLPSILDQAFRGEL